ncbi:MAG: hypothetical protein LBU86_04580 [Oscillospiraceae bacterium]|jgi:hypothetical protein|nr:hypothetical protein [Oscillospiraceae bacterium]
MKKTLTVLLAAFMMVGFASCLDQGRNDDFTNDFDYDGYVSTVDETPGEAIESYEINDNDYPQTKRAAQF